MTVAVSVFKRLQCAMERTLLALRKSCPAQGNRRHAVLGS